MELFNIGPLELIFILLGPDNMVKTARSTGKWIYKFVRSPMWADFLNISLEIREFPEKIVREAGIEENLKELRETSDKLKQDVKIPVDPIEIGSFKVGLPTENIMRARKSSETPAGDESQEPNKISESNESQGK